MLRGGYGSTALRITAGIAGVPVRSVKLAPGRELPTRSDRLHRGFHTPVLYARSTKTARKALPPHVKAANDELSLAGQGVLHEPPVGSKMSERPYLSSLITKAKKTHPTTRLAKTHRKGIARQYFAQQHKMEDIRFRGTPLALPLIVAAIKKQDQLMTWLALHPNEMLLKPTRMTAQGTNGAFRSGFSWLNRISAFIIGAPTTCAGTAKEVAESDLGNTKSMARPITPAPPKIQIESSAEKSILPSLIRPSVLASTSSGFITAVPKRLKSVERWPTWGQNHTTFNAANLPPLPPIRDPTAWKLFSEPLIDPILLRDLALEGDGVVYLATVRAVAKRKKVEQMPTMLPLRGLLVRNDTLSFIALAYGLRQVPIPHAGPTQKSFADHFEAYLGALLRQATKDKTLDDFYALCDEIFSEKVFPQLEKDIKPFMMYLNSLAKNTGPSKKDRSATSPSLPVVSPPPLPTPSEKPIGDLPLNIVIERTDRSGPLFASSGWRST